MLGGTLCGLSLLYFFADVWCWVEEKGQRTHNDLNHAVLFYNSNNYWNHSTSVSSWTPHYLGDDELLGIAHNMYARCSLVRDNTRLSESYWWLASWKDKWESEMISGSIKLTPFHFSVLSISYYFLNLTVSLFRKVFLCSDFILHTQSGVRFRIRRGV